MEFSPRFLVISLGNPGEQYANTLHSAGHMVLSELGQRLHRANPAQPPFRSERLAKKTAAKASRGPKYTLLQCPTYMNVSGDWVSPVWRKFYLGDERFSDNDDNSTPLGLVIVHDELELDMGEVKVRPWQRSHRGHNGLRSIQKLMSPAAFPGCKWAKVSLGIGRPEQRDTQTVSDYVLKPLSKYQTRLLVDKATDPLLAALQEIEAEWRAQWEKDLKKATG